MNIELAKEWNYTIALGLERLDVVPSMYRGVVLTFTQSAVSRLNSLVLSGYEAAIDLEDAELHRNIIQLGPQPINSQKPLAPIFKLNTKRNTPWRICQTSCG